MPRWSKPSSLRLNIAGALDHHNGEQTFSPGDSFLLREAASEEGRVMRWAFWFWSRQWALADATPTALTWFGADRLNKTIVSVKDCVYLLDNSSWDIRSL